MIANIKYLPRKRNELYTGDGFGYMLTLPLLRFVPLMIGKYTLSVLLKYFYISRIKF